MGRDEDPLLEWRRKSKNIIYTELITKPCDEYEMFGSHKQIHLNITFGSNKGRRSNT